MKSRGVACKYKFAEMQIYAYKDERFPQSKEGNCFKLNYIKLN